MSTRPRHAALLFACLLAVGTILHAASPSSGVTTFGSGGSDVALSTGAGSAGVTAANVAGTGWDVRVQTTTATSIDIARGDLAWGTGDGVYYTDAAMDGEPLQSFRVSSNDGTIFDLRRVKVSVSTTSPGDAGTARLTVTGYRAGSPAPGAAADFDVSIGSGQSGLETLDVSADADFVGVDAFTITNTAGLGVVFMGIDDLDVASVRSPDTTPPTVTSLTSSTANGTYKIGAVLSIQVNFSEAVTVTGTPQLTLETGVTDRTVNYASGSGTGTLTFSYTIQVGDSSADLDYVATNALALNGGTIRDAAGNNATLTLASPGAANSLGNNKALVVDGVMPAVTGTAPAGGAVSTDTSVDFMVGFSESVSNISTDDFALGTTGSASGTIASVSANSGSSVMVTVSGITGNGTIKLNLNAATNIADAAGNSGPAAYTSGTAHTVAIPTAPDAPTIGTATPGDGQASVAFTAPGNDGGSAITGYTVTSNPGGITATGGSSPVVVTGLANGTTYTFTVTATNAIGTSVASGTSSAVTPKGDQTITFANPGAQNFGTTPALTAAATSGLTVVFSSSTPGVCTITAGGALTFVTAGSCTIDADQAGNGAWNAASTVSRTFTVNAVVPGAPTIGIATAGDTQATVTFTAPASSGGTTITGYTVTANPGGATGTGAGSPITVTGLSNGVAYTFTVTATNSAGTGAASAASNSVTPASPQTITFANPGAQNFGTSPNLSILGGGASSTSGLPVTFTSSTTGVCTVTSGGILTFVTAGTCTINADQAGNASYLPATQVTRSFTVNPVVPGAPTSVVATAGDTQASVAFVAPVNSGGSAVTGYTVTVSPPDVAPVNGASSPVVVTGLTNGQAYTFTVTADNAAGTGPASSASNAVTPAATQTITFNNPGAQNFGTSPTLTATSDSGLTPTFTSSTISVCTITSGGALTFLSAGACTINADQAGNGSYLPAAQVSRTFAVNAVLPGAPSIGAATAADGQATVTFAAPASNGGTPITGYTATASPGGATASGGGSPLTVTGLTNGLTYTFTVTATNAVGTGAASAASNAVTPEFPPVTVSLAAAPTTASEDAGTAVTVTVTRSAAIGTPTVVSLSVSGTATAGDDYSGAVAAVTIPANATSASFTLTPIADTVPEADETVVIALAAGTGYSVAAPSGATVTIADDDAAGPTGLRITAMRGREVTLAWALPVHGPAATGVLLEGGETPGSALGVGQLLALTPAATVTLPAGSYYVRVRLMTSEGLSAPSNDVRVHVEVPVPPSAPSGLLATVEGSALHLAWTPTFGGGAPTGAVLDVSGDLAGSFAVPAGDTFSMAAVPGGTYTVAVRQANAAGVSAASAPVTVTVPGMCAAAPQPPVDFLAWSTGGRAFVQWAPPAGGAAPTGYALRVSGAWTGTVPLTARALVSPAPAGAYTLAVVATNACGASAPTTAQTIEVHGGAAGTPPVAVADAYTTPFGATLTVPAPGVLANDGAQGGGAMTAAVVAAPGHGTVTLAADGGFTYVPRAGFTGTDTFTYRVSTLAGGEGPPAYVSIAVGGTSSTRAPNTVADSFATAGATSLTVAAPQGLLANDDANGGGAMTAVPAAPPAHGTLSLAADGGFTYTPQPGFSGTDRFTYRASTAEGGTSDETTVLVAVAAPGAPLAPTGLRVTAMRGQEVSLAWTLPAAGPAPTGVLLEGGETPGAVQAVGQLAGALPAATVTLPAGSLYVRARAMTASGLSDPSNEVLVHVGVPIPPSAPRHLLGVVDGAAVHLAWTPTFEGGAPTGAVVDVTGDVTTSLTLGPGDTFRYPLAPSGTYTFTVRQANAAGTSAASAPVTLTVPGTCAGVPQPPADVVAYSVAGLAHVLWSPPTSGPAPTGYALQVAGAFHGTIPVTGRSFRAPAPAGAYTVAVVATNACGASAPTSVRAVVVP